MDKVTVIVLQPFDLLYKILEEKEYSLLEHFSVQLYIRSEFSLSLLSSGTLSIKLLHHPCCLCGSY